MKVHAHPVDIHAKSCRNLCKSDGNRCKHQSNSMQTHVKPKRDPCKILSKSMPNPIDIHGKCNRILLQIQLKPMQNPCKYCANPPNPCKTRANHPKSNPSTKTKQNIIQKAAQYRHNNVTITLSVMDLKKVEGLKSNFLTASKTAHS